MIMSLELVVIGEEVEEILEYADNVNVVAKWTTYVVHLTTKDLIRFVHDV